MKPKSATMNRIVVLGDDVSAVSALLRANRQSMKLVPMAFWNSIIDESRGSRCDVLNEYGFYKEKGNHFHWLTGTFFLAAGPDKPFGNWIETECNFDGMRAAVMCGVPKEYSALKNCLILMDHGFHSPLQPKINLRTKKGKQIQNLEGEMHVELLGNTRVLKPGANAELVRHGDGTALAFNEGGYATEIYLPAKQNMGFLTCMYHNTFFTRVNPFERNGIALAWI